jgi:RNA recognition motif-containing protein
MGTKLYVGNLNFQTTEQDLRSFFEADGRQVKEVSIVTDRETGRPRGFAFVRMATEQDAQTAITGLDGRELDGRPLRINEAQERPAGGPRFGGGGGGGGGGRFGGGGGGGGGRGFGGGGGGRGGYGGGRGGGGRGFGGRGRDREFGDESY